MEVHKGRVLLDGIDVSTLGLHELRKRISVIPQVHIYFIVSLAVIQSCIEMLLSDKPLNILSLENLNSTCCSCDSTRPPSSSAAA